jgi:hypothetical protein
VEEPLHNALPVAGECRKLLCCARTLRDSNSVFHYPILLNLDNGTVSLRGSFLWIVENAALRRAIVAGQMWEHGF